MNSIYKKLLALILISIALIPVTYAQNSAEPKKLTESKEINGYPVTLMGDTIFYIYDAIGPFSPEERAKAISKRLSKILNDPFADPNNIVIFDEDLATNILIDDVVIMTVTDGDAKAVNIARKNLANDFADNIRNELKELKKRTSIKNTIASIAISLAVTGLLIFTLILLRKILKIFYKKISNWKYTKIHSIKIHDFEVLNVGRIAIIITWFVKILYFIVFIVSIYFYFSFVLSLFPWTKGFAGRLLSYILSGFSSIGKAIGFFAPYLLLVLVVTFITYYILKVIQLIFNEIEKGTIKPSGFYQEWAQPTYKILRFFIIIIASMTVYSYFPGADSIIFKGILIFLGLIFSLGLLPTIKTIIAGIIVVYMRSFKVGDLVKIGDVSGEVIYKSTLVTRLRTDKNVEITIPNSMVFDNQITNYSSLIQSGKKLVLNITIAIGYDVSWRKVHELLISSALSTNGVLTEPAPYILQKSLNRFHVRYELNVYTEKPDMMANICSELYQNIQDKLKEAGIDIGLQHHKKE